MLIHPSRFPCARKYARYRPKGAIGSELRWVKRSSEQAHFAPAVLAG